jgi:hypothetical protein
MILNQCPHCGVRHVSIQHHSELPFKDNDHSVKWLVKRCMNDTCRRLVLVEMDKKAVTKIFPFVGYELETQTSIPQAIIDDVREAGLCLGAGCFKASLVMSRRVLQRCLKEQGCAQYKLVDAIQLCSSKFHIT